MAKAIHSIALLYGLFLLGYFIHWPLSAELQAGSFSKPGFKQKQYLIS